MSVKIRFHPSHGRPLSSYHDKHILPQNVTFSTFLTFAGWNRKLSYQLVELKIIFLLLAYSPDSDKKKTQCKLVNLWQTKSENL